MQADIGFCQLWVECELGESATNVVIIDIDNVIQVCACDAPQERAVPMENGAISNFWLAEFDVNELVDGVRVAS